MNNFKTIAIDTAYVCTFLKKKRITETVFSTTLGYDKSWWAYVKRSSGRVKPETATMMCSLYKMDEDKLIVKDKPEKTAVKQESKKQIYADDSMKALMSTVVRIEQKLNMLLERIGE